MPLRGLCLRFVPTARGSVVNTMAKQTKRPRGQIESPPRGIYIGATYAERTRDWPPFSHSPSQDRITRFDDRQAAEAELARVQSYARTRDCEKSADRGVRC